MTGEDRSATVRALLEERRGYVARGYVERVALVDAQLSQLRAPPSGTPKTLGARRVVSVIAARARSRRSRRD